MSCFPDLLYAKNSCVAPSLPSTCILRDLSIMTWLIAGIPNQGAHQLVLTFVPGASDTG